MEFRVEELRVEVGISGFAVGAAVSEHEAPRSLQSAVLLGWRPW